MGIRATRPSPDVVSGCRSMLAAVTAALGSAVQSPANSAAASAWADMIWGDLKSFLRSECCQIFGIFLFSNCLLVEYVEQGSCGPSIRFAL